MNSHAMRRAVPGQIQPARTKASDLTDALDWALAENARSGSPLFGRIDPALVALSGWSCGGLQALQVAKDPRVKTMVLHNTGVLNDGPGAIPGMDVGKDVLPTLHTPTIYILGGPKDIAYANGMDDFARIAHVPVAVANLPVGHGGVRRAERRRGGVGRRELARVAASSRLAERWTVRG